MKNSLKIILSLAVTLSAASCAKHYEVANVERTRILVDSVYDGQTSDEVENFLKPYRQRVDSMMSPIVGHTARYMSGYRPESPLSNLLADILVWASADYDEKPDMGVYNVGGIRASLPAGAVTYGDVLDVAPFENKICFLTLTGDKLLQLFREMAATGGEGVSHGVELKIAQDGRLLSARLNGEEIVPNKEYRIATINYLAEGNDHLDAFKQKTNFVSPTEARNNTRVIIANYFKEMERQGVTVDAKVEGRITILKLCTTY